MIRYTLLTIFITYFFFRAWRDWFTSLCALIMLVAVIEHPDMPKSLGGIQGANPWNVLLVGVLIGWIRNRGREHLKADPPIGIALLMTWYVGVIITGYGRLMVDFGTIEALWHAGELSAEPSKVRLTSELLINALKWMVPGILVYDGCRSDKRMRMVVVSVLSVYVLLALQVIQKMPASAILKTGDELSYLAIKLLPKEVGFHRVNLSMMFAGASWAVLAASFLHKSRRLRQLHLGAAAVVVYAQALTGGRMGYVTWGVLGLMFGVVRYRRFLLVMPIALVLLVNFVPAAKERMMMGFAGGEIDVARDSKIAKAEEGKRDDYTVTAGRNVAWPKVVELIKEKPQFGWGRAGMVRSGLAGRLKREYKEAFAHPHQAYLELWLDNGFVGGGPVLLFYILVMLRSVSLARDRSSLQCRVVGALCAALTGALLVASFGSQTFYPREGAMGMWCAIGLMLRLYVGRVARDRAFTKKRLRGRIARPQFQPAQRA